MPWDILKMLERILIVPFYQKLQLILEVIFSMVLVPLQLLVIWPISLWKSMILFNGRWYNYLGFKPLNSLNSFFYRIQFLNIELFGRNGVTPYLGLGNHRLSNFFHLSLFSSFLFSNAGAVTILWGTIIWVFFHLAWANQVTYTWVLLVSFIVFFSSTAYSMAFVRQNYNIVGWVWFPLFLFSLLNNHLICSSIFLLAGSFGSITMVSTSIFIAIVCGITNASFEYFLITIPAFLKLTSHFVSAFSDSEFRDSVNNIAKQIGLKRNGVRYKRKSMGFSLVNIYLTGLYLIGMFILAFWVGIPIMVFSAFLLVVINQFFFRFMDLQSCCIFFLSVFSAQVISTPINWAGVLALLIVANPVPVLFGVCSFKETGSLLKMPVFSPFDHSRLISDLKEFFKPVKAFSRVLMCFENPDGRYENLFNGYRVLVEPSQFAAIGQSIHLFPDWYGVAATNRSDLPDFWGVGLDDVLKNLDFWKADYAILFVGPDYELPKNWLLNFIEISSFDWGKRIKSFSDSSSWPKGHDLKWLLLERVKNTD